MSASEKPAPPTEIDDLEVVAVEGDERTMSHTRRLGSKAPKEPDSKHGDPNAGPNGADSKTGGKPYLPGDVIQGKYKLTRIIGRGGMGAVWLAHNVPLDIDVAIKLIRRDRTAPGAGERLLTEARAAARLMHPAIVRVFDFGESEQGDPFIVMELLRGESLNAILRRKKRLTPQLAVQMLLPVAGALASAHGKGIVHRDLKPDNIIVVTDETGALVPKIVDFGIAKLMTPGVEHHVTLAGEVLGSPDYMSPEQARGAATVGEASDIWTFSVVLYELITGKRPFDGPNYNALIAAIITADPVPLATHGITDVALAGIIEHGLTKDIGGRWPRIRDMGAALASWAVANGIEEDVMGNPITKLWLAGATRRLLTVQPETGEAPLRSGPIASTPPAASESGAAFFSPPGKPADPGSPGRVAASIEGRRASARNALALVISIVALGGAAVTVFLMYEHSRASGALVPSVAPTTAPSSSATAIATSAGTALDAASAAPSSSAAPDPSASASAAASSRPPSPWRYPRKNKAPAAPKGIKF